MAKQNCEGLLTVDGVNGGGEGEISIKNKFVNLGFGGKISIKNKFLNLGFGGPCHWYKLFQFVYKNCSLNIYTLSFLLK